MLCSKAAERLCAAINAWQNVASGQAILKRLKHVISLGCPGGLDVQSSQ